MRRLIPILAVAACQSSEVEPLDNPVPIVETIDPTYVAIGAAVSIAIRGLGFVEGSQARWNGEARPTTFVDEAHLTITLTAQDLLAVSGAIDVVSPPPGGGTSEFSTLTVTTPPPTLESVSPISAPAVVTTALEIDAVGSGFVTGSRLYWDGVPLPTTVTSGTTLSAAVPDYLLRVGHAAALTIRNPLPSIGESATMTFTVENPVPSLTSLTPNGLPVGLGGQVEITGDGFVYGASVIIGVARVTPSQVSASTIVLDVPAELAASAGTISLSVENPAPAGGESNALALPIWGFPPVVEFLVPAQVFAGSPDITLAIVGEQFENGATLTWNGSPRPITVLNEGRIELAVSAADLADPDTVGIVITNPSEGAFTTAQLPILPASSFADLVVMEIWGYSGLRVSRLDGTNARSLSVNNRATRMDASPIGPYAVYYDDQSTRLWQIDLIADVARRVTSGALEATLAQESWPRYSADGTWIYFTGQPYSGNTQIWRVRSDGSDAEPVVSSPSHAAHHASPSRDGTRLVYHRASEYGGPLWVQDLGTSIGTPLGVDGLTSRWSPLDAWIVYLTPSWDLRAIRPDGTDDFLVTSSVDVGHGFDFAPDGSFIVATTQDGDPIRISFPSGDVEPLPGLPRIGSIAWFGP